MPPGRTPLTTEVGPPVDGDDRRWRTWLDSVVVQPDRRRHSVTVWERAVSLTEHELAWLEPDRAATLTRAALLHDIGRWCDPAEAEPHGLAGARFVADLGMYDVSALVLHHSGGRFEAHLRGFEPFDRWPAPDEELLAVLTYLDRTTTSGGDETSVALRRQELADRYGHGSVKVAVFDLALVDVRRGERLVLGGPPARRR